MRIILLTYISRSGSTFLSSELGKSPSVLACPEADCLFDIFLINPGDYIKSSHKTNIIRKLLNDSKFGSWELKDSINTIDFSLTCFEIFYQILNAYRLKIKPGADKVTYKAESLFHVVSDRNKNHILWERCDIVSIVRDIRGIYNSQRSTRIPENNKIMSRNLFKTCLYWNSFIQKMIINSTTDNTIIYYESLVNDYPKSLLEIAHNLNINAQNFTSNSDLFVRLPSGHQKIHENILLPPLKSCISRWEVALPKRIVKQIELISGKNLKELGYRVENQQKQLYISVLLILQLIEYLSFRARKKINSVFKSILHASPYKKPVF